MDSASVGSLHGAGSDSFANSGRDDGPHGGDEQAQHHTDDGAPAADGSATDDFARMAELTQSTAELYRDTASADAHI